MHSKRLILRLRYFLKFRRIRVNTINNQLWYTQCCRGQGVKKKKKKTRSRNGLVYHQRDNSDDKSLQLSRFKMQNDTSNNKKKNLSSAERAITSVQWWSRDRGGLGSPQASTSWREYMAPFTPSTYLPTSLSLTYLSCCLHGVHDSNDMQWVCVKCCVSVCVSYK